MIIPLTDEFPDELLILIYNRIVASGVGADLFFDGRVQCADDFIRDMRDTSNNVCFSSDGKEILGGAWLNNFRENSAFVHFFTLPKAWGNAADALRPIIGYWFECDQLDVIIGEYPACHDRVTNFLDKIGFTYLGEIPGIKHGPHRVGSKVCYITREDYHGQK